MNNRLAADISLLLVAIIWGVTFVVVQNAISLLEPFTFNALRFLTAAILLICWLLLFKRSQFRLLSGKLLLSGMLLGFWLFIGYAFQTVGLLYTTSSKAGFLTGLSVILVPVLSLLLFRLRLSRNAFAGILAATAGLFFLSVADVTVFNKGDFLVLICAFGFAMQIIHTWKLAKSFPALLLTIVQLGTVSILSFIFAFVFEDWKQAFNTGATLNAEVITALLITGVLATALAFLIQTSVQTFTSPARVALIFATEPVFAAITGFIWAGDRLSANAFTGCLLIFAGMVLAELPEDFFIRRSRRNQPLPVKKKADQGG